MFNFWTVLYLVVIGLVAGYLARLLVKGRDAHGTGEIRMVGVGRRLLADRCRLRHSKANSQP